MTGPDTATFADHIRDPGPEAPRNVDPSTWFLPARLFGALIGIFIALITIGAPMALWVWNTNSYVKKFETLLTKIDKQMVVPSQFNEWTYELRAANPTINLTVPRLPKKSCDQYQGE